ncbi:MAG: hypothetical protein ABL857_04210 [Rickettsiales bacterium]
MGGENKGAKGLNGGLEEDRKGGPKFGGDNGVVSPYVNGHSHDGIDYPKSYGRPIPKWTYEDSNESYSNDGNDTTKHIILVADDYIAVSKFLEKFPKDSEQAQSSLVPISLNVKKAVNSFYQMSKDHGQGITVESYLQSLRRVQSATDQVIVDMSVYSERQSIISDAANFITRNPEGTENARIDMQALLSEPIKSYVEKYYEMGHKPINYDVSGMEKGDGDFSLSSREISIAKDFAAKYPRPIAQLSSDANADVVHAVNGLLYDKALRSLGRDIKTLVTIAENELGRNGGYTAIPQSNASITELHIEEAEKSLGEERIKLETRDKKLSPDEINEARKLFAKKALVEPRSGDEIDVLRKRFLSDHDASDADKRDGQRISFPESFGSSDVNMLVKQYLEDYKDSYFNHANPADNPNTPANVETRRFDSDPAVKAAEARLSDTQISNLRAGLVGSKAEAFVGHSSSQSAGKISFEDVVGILSLPKLIDNVEDKLVPPANKPPSNPSVVPGQR